MQAKFNSKCKLCGEPIQAGTSISKRRGIWAHVVCPIVDDADRAYADEVASERRYFDAEMARGAAMAEHIRDTERFFGTEAALAEELAWELRDPAY